MMKWFEAVKAKRIELGLTQRDLAQSVGCTAAAIQKIEAGRVDRSRSAVRLARVLGLASDLIDPDGSAPTLQPKDGRKHSTAALLASGEPYINPRGETAVQILLEHDDGCLDIYNGGRWFTSRPGNLMHSEGVFAFHYTGRLMSPEFEAGDMLFVSHRQDVVGLSCLFLSPGSEPVGLRRAALRRVVSQGFGGYEVKVWQPSKACPERQEFKRSAWPVCMPVVATYQGRVTYNAGRLGPGDVGREAKDADTKVR